MIERIANLKLIDRLAYVWLGQVPQAPGFDAKPSDAGKAPGFQRRQEGRLSNEGLAVRHLS